MIDLDRCPCSGKTLSKLIQPGVLTVLASGPLHGYRIVEKLSGLRILGGRKPDTAGVYRALKTMEKRKLVKARWDTSASGPARHLYAMTRSGRACLDRWVSTLTDYRRAVGELLRVVRSASRSPQGDAARRAHRTPAKGKDRP